MEATQQPVEIVDWPFTALTPQVWADLPAPYRQALDEQLTSIIVFWREQSHSADGRLL